MNMHVRRMPWLRVGLCVRVKHGPPDSYPSDGEEYGNAQRTTGAQLPGREPQPRSLPHEADHEHDGASRDES